MPLVKQQIDVPITAGIDDFSDPKQSDALSFSENLYINRNGELQRRDGLEAVSSSAVVTDNNRNASAVITTGQGLIPYQSAPVVVGVDAYSRTVNGIASVDHAQSGGGLYQPQTDEADTKWSVLGDTRHAIIDVINGPSQEAYHRVAGFARSGVYELWAWAGYEDSILGSPKQYTQWAIRNTTTNTWYGFGSINLSGTSLYAGVATESDSSDDKFLIVLHSGLVTDVIVVDPLTGTSSNKAILSGNVSAAQACCQGTEGAKTVVIVATDNAGTLRLSKVYGDGTITREQDTNVALNDVTIDYLAVGELAGGDGEIVVLRVKKDAEEALLYVFPNEYGASQAPTASVTVDATLSADEFVSFGVVGGAHDELAFSGTTGTDSIYATVGKIDAISTVDACETETYLVEYDSAGPTLTVRDSWEISGVLPGRPLIWNKRPYLPIHVGNNVATSAASKLTANRLVLVELRVDETPALYGVPVGLLVPQDNQTVDPSDTNRLMCASWADSTGAAIATRRQARVVGLENKQETTPVVRHVLSVAQLTTGRPPQYAVSGKDVIVSGPLVRHIDGQAQELGFLANPEVHRVQAVGTGLTGDFGLSYIYEWVDRLGQRHRSAPAETTTITLANENPQLDRLPIKLAAQRGPTAAITDKSLGVDAVAFRTAAGAAVPRRSDSEPNGEAWVDAGTGFLAQIVDDTDAALADNEVLYTTGGRLTIDPPPPSNIILAHKNRVFVVDASNPTDIWPSDERVSGIGPTFHAETVLSLVDGGEITGLGALDDYVAVFKEGSVYVFGGSGPNDTGTGGFSPVQGVTSSVGCGYPNSVVSFDGGVLFKDKSAGWHLLDRGLNIIPIGLAVKSYDSHEVYRAALCPNQRQIRVVHNPADTKDVLVFDTLRNKWDRYDYNYSAQDPLPPQDVCEIDGTVYMLDTDGVVYTETDTSSVEDDGVAYEMAFRSHWINNEQSDFQRIWWVKIVGEWPTSGSLVVWFFYDYNNEAVAEEATVDVTTIASDGVLRIKPQRAQCKAFKIGLNFAIYRISKVSLEVGVRPARIGRIADATVTREE